MASLHELDHVPARNRAAALAKLWSARLDPVEIAAAHPDRFAAALSVDELGPLRIAHLACSPATVTGATPRPVPAQQRTHTVVFQTHGSSSICHHGQEVRLDEGDLTLLDNQAAYRLTLDDDAELLLLRVPSSILKAHLPSPECFCARRLPGDAGLSGTAATMVLSLFGRSGTELALRHQGRVARHVLDVVATCYAIAFDSLAKASSIVSGRHATVKLYIEQHLRDPDLSPCSIAERLKLSSRYLRMIFAANKETVSAYILRRRLEECARQIGDPCWRGHSITEIAFAWGFNSAPHFTRSFRERYNMPPRDHRRLKLEEHSAIGRRAAATPLLAQAA